MGSNLICKFIVLIFCLVSANANAVTENGYAVGSWLVKQEYVNQVEEKINAEVLEKTLKNGDSEVDFGYSLPGLIEIRQLCLEHIHSLFEKNARPPLVADIGAGFGNMTWKILAAGGKVDAYEAQIPTANKMEELINQIDTNWWTESDLKDSLKVFPIDVLTLSVNENNSAKYDVIWLGNIIHFMSPDDFKVLGSIIFNMLKPEGKVFIETNTIFFWFNEEGGEHIKNIYNYGVASDREFPGFLGINKAILSGSWYKKEVVVSAIDQRVLTKNKQHRMTANTTGYLALDSFSVEAKNLDEALEAEKTSEKGKIKKFHLLVNLLDKKSADRNFSAMGFSVIDSFYYYTFIPTLNRVKDEKAFPNAIAIVLEKPIAPLGGFYGTASFK